MFSGGTAFNLNKLMGRRVWLDLYPLLPQSLRTVLLWKCTLVIL